MTRTVVTRRSLLIAGAAALATPYAWSRPARAASQVVCATEAAPGLRTTTWLAARAGRDHT